MDFLLDYLVTDSATKHKLTSVCDYGTQSNITTMNIMFGKYKSLLLESSPKTFLFLVKPAINYTMLG